jgi:cytochrome c oxidase subunit 1
MSSTTADIHGHPEAGDARETPVNYLNVRKTVASWLLTIDHKRIGILYLLGIAAFFVAGAFFAVLIRLELLTPEGDLMQSATYNRVFTLHGVIMIFFFLVPSIPAVLGNFVLPMMLGAKDLAFPRLNLLSWYLYMIGGVFAVLALVFGGVDTGWTFYTPFSSFASNSNVVLAVAAGFVSGFSSVLTGINFMVSIHKLRAPGLTWFRLPLFVWANYATSIIQILATPVLAISLVLIAIERLWKVGIFDPSLGGDPILFQHLFWFYSHPAVYIMILPGMGVISEVICCFARKRIFGYHMIAFSSLAIAILGFLVWGHHMFVSTQSMYSGLVFSVLTMLVAIPSAIKVFNWTATLYKGQIYFEAPMLYVFGFLGLFTIGGLTGIFLGLVAADVHFHDTYFVVAHFHYVMVGGMVMALLAGIHFWWPKMFGRMYPRHLAQLSAIVIFVGFNLTFFPQFILGMLGMPRRYHNYIDEFQILNVLSTAGALVMGLGFLLCFIYLPVSLVTGRRAGKNPWYATGLEWTTASPPQTENFDHTPVVTEEPYHYDNEQAPESMGRGA